MAHPPSLSMSHTTLWVQLLEAKVSILDTYYHFVLLYKLCQLQKEKKHKYRGGLESLNRYTTQDSLRCSRFKSPATMFCISVLWLTLAFNHRNHMNTGYGQALNKARDNTIYKPPFMAAILASLSRCEVICMHSRSTFSD